VDWFVDILPLAKLGFRDVLNPEGRPPYHASDMLKLFMSGYKKKLRSSYQLEEACRVNLEVIWLMRGLRPSARKIAYFRKDNSKAFEQAFRHFVLMLKDMDLISGAIIAIDSFKIRAQNSLKNNFNQGEIDRHIEYIDTQINEFLEELESEETEEPQRQELEQKIATQQKRRKEYKSIEKKLKQSGETQISKTGSDAKSVVLHRNVVNVGCNIQAGCDGKHNPPTGRKTVEFFC
jgi:transposase